MPPWLSRTSARAVTAGASAGVLVGCLVGDPRPRPGSVLLTASSDDALRNGLMTTDGWTIAYERFIVAMGNASPEGDACTFYTDTAYNRVLDMRAPGPQKLSIIYALGACHIDYEVSNPASDSVAGFPVR